MSDVYLHLASNHVPVVGVAVCVLFLLAGWLWKSREIQVVTSFVLVGIALLTILVYRTGNGAEHVVEKLPGVSKSILEEHEEAGLKSLVLVEILGALALANLLVYRLRPQLMRASGGVLLAFALFTSAALIWTANLGGQIRHSEIRGGGAAAAGENEGGD